MIALAIWLIPFPAMCRISQHLQVPGSLFHVDRGTLKAYGPASGQSSEVAEFSAVKKMGKSVVTHVLHSLKQGALAVFFHPREGRGTFLQPCMKQHSDPKRDKSLQRLMLWPLTGQ